MKREEETVLRLPQRAPEDVERALRLSVGDIEQQVTAMMGALASKVALSQVVLDCLGLGWCCSIRRAACCRPTARPSGCWPRPTA
ncbi:hypothetical protein [Chitinimonas koreensis]|uniref:hypothetical protein n=1 Tax=Chitinimonas koreensis TaxID=356302 RepID=UPI0016544A70|nr:hypothetical protein [Chitinimonas koreensis]QNM96228.1 hypothetical protein H9L41_20855 [Chitinimonas koreensis]